MKIEDVGSYSYGYRLEHYRKQYGIGTMAEIDKLSKEQFDDRFRMSNDAVKAEMLDEIHVMLRTLLGIKDDEDETSN